MRASDGVMHADRDVTVKVTDADEGGKVTVSPPDAEIGVELTATIADSDGGVPTAGTFTDIKWTWHRLVADDAAAAAAVDADADNVIKGETSDTYTPTALDRGNYLKAMVTYTDRTRDEDNDGTDNAATNDFVGFMNTVTSDVTNAVRNNPANQRPEFKEGAKTARLVEENTRALVGEGADDADDDAIADNPADNVGGGPVVATDDDEGQTQTYTLGGPDMDAFRLRSNGQLEVSGKARLDYETKNEYTVIVTATDSSDAGNNSASITVTIHVTDLDERPVITASGGGLVITGPSSASHPENSGGVVARARYSVSGGDGGTVAWSLTGSDASRFSISSSGVVSFRGTTTPNYESDNSYTFTVRAMVDSEILTRSVTVNVTNEDEDGTVTISPSRLIEVDTVLTATLTDPDGGRRNMSWQWVREITGAGSVNVGANSNTYTVVADDAEAYLVARVSYADAQGSGKSAESMRTEAVAAVSAPQTVLERYDTITVDGRIDRAEASRALFQFARNEIDRATVSDVVALYSGIV